jgi:hypothetical protein
MKFIIYSIILIAIFTVANIIEYLYEKYMWNHGCNKCKSTWTFVGGTIYQCKCKQKTFTWFQRRKYDN